MDRRKTRLGEQARVSLERAIGLRFKHLGDFVEELTVNLSAGGMFIRTRRPHPVGSVFEFELRLGSDRPPIAGKAQVTWVRRRSDYIDKPAGMGVRFVELDDESRRSVAELVASHEAEGGHPSDLEQPTGEERAAEGSEPDDARARSEPSQVTAEPSSVAVPPPSPRPPAAVISSPPAAAGAASTSDRRRRSRRPWILLTIALALALAATLWPRSRPAAPSGADTAPPEPDAPATMATANDTENSAQATETDQLRAVDEWARAWSEQRIDDYLAAYSSRFEPPDGLGRETWESRRRTRVLAPDWIEVGLAFVELEAAGADASRVRFVQVYESDSYRDVVRKALDLEREGGAWKILRETVEP